MERYFVRFPEGQVHTDVGPAFKLEPEHTTNFFAENNRSVILAALSDQQRNDIISAGGEVFEDYQFFPALDPFDENLIPPNRRFWERGSGAVRPAGPSPWEGKSLTDVLRDVGVPEAWQISKGEGVTLVIVDSGIKDDTSAFPHARRSPLQISPAYGTDAWSDTLGHGTMVAFIAGASAVNERSSGVAPGATILPARTNYKATDLYVIYDRLLSAKANGEISGPIVINNSYAVTACSGAGILPPQHPYAEICKRVVAEGMFMVFAAGNNHADLCCGNPPTADSPNTIWAVNSLDEVLTVGAVNWDKSNTAGAHGNSSRGPGEWATEQTKPDVVAPCYGEIRWGNEFRNMEWWGTSGAAPVVSGIAALALSAAQTRNITIAPSDLSVAFRASCEVLPGASTTCVGGGLVNARRLINWAIAGR